MGWFVANPMPESNSKTSQYALDANGTYIPAENRFPSSMGGRVQAVGRLHSFTWSEMWNPYPPWNSPKSHGSEFADRRRSFERLYAWARRQRCSSEQTRF